MTFYDRDSLRPDTAHSPTDADADAVYAAGGVLCTVVANHAAQFTQRHPEALVSDAWHQSTRYFFVQAPAAAEQVRREMDAALEP